MKINRTIFKSKKIQYVCSYKNSKQQLELVIDNIEDLCYYDEFAVEYFEKQFKIKE